MTLLSPDGPDLPGGAVGLGAVTQRLAAEPEHGDRGNGIKSNFSATAEEGGLNAMRHRITSYPHLSLV